MSIWDESVILRPARMTAPFVACRTPCSSPPGDILCAVDLGESNPRLADIRNGDEIKIEYDDTAIVGIVEWQAWNRFVVREGV